VQHHLLETPPNVILKRSVRGEPPLHRIRYSPDSIVIPTNPRAILEWAACHIERVGLYQGDDLFAGPGRTVTLACWPRGAINVAAGDGRRSSARRYDGAAIRHGRASAHRMLAEHLAGRPREVSDPGEAERVHCQFLDLWSEQPSMTAARAAKATRDAAGEADLLL
jgi:hypothetical protein